MDGTKYTRDGLPLFNQRQIDRIKAKLRSKPCPVCKAKAGKKCQNTINGRSMDHIHFGRVPDNWDSAAFIQTANSKSKKQCLPS